MPYYSPQACAPTPDPVKQALLAGIEAAAKSGDIKTIEVLTRELQAHAARVQKAESPQADVIPFQPSKATERAG